MALSVSQRQYSRRTQFGSMKHPWLRSLWDVKTNSPSKRDGIDYIQELTMKCEGLDHLYRINWMVHHYPKHKNPLNNNEYLRNFSNETLCTAATLFHRFYTVHSVAKFNVIDVATVCVFVACKNWNPVPIVTLAQYLFHKRYSRKPAVDSLTDVVKLLTLLEEILLQTVGFDLNVQLPHPYLMEFVKRVGIENRKCYPEIVKRAYFLATEIFMFTDWCIRFSPPKIAFSCMKIAIDSIGKPTLGDLVLLPLALCHIYDKSLAAHEIQIMEKEVKNHHLLDLGNICFKDHFMLTRESRSTAPLSDTIRGAPSNSTSTFNRNTQPAKSDLAVEWRNVLMSHPRAIVPSNSQQVQQFKRPRLEPGRDLRPQDNVFEGNACPA